MKLEKIITIGFIIGFLCLSAMAYMAFGAEQQCTAESVQDKVLNYPYYYDNKEGLTCEIDFAAGVGLSGFWGSAIAQIECTEYKGLTYEKTGRMVRYILTDDLLTVDGIKYVMGASGNIYQIIPDVLIKRK